MGSLSLLMQMVLWDTITSFMSTAVVIVIVLNDLFDFVLDVH